MKKLFMGSIAILLFTIAISIFQISCEKEAVAYNSNYKLPPATTSTLGGVIVGNGLSATLNGTLTASAGIRSQQGKLLLMRQISSKQVLLKSRLLIWMGQTNQKFQFLYRQVCILNMLQYCLMDKR